MADDVDRLLAEADRLEYGAGKVAVCEEAVRAADTRNDLADGFRARLDLIEAAYFGGQPDVLLVAFAWVLGQLDRHPDRFADPNTLYHVLWRYKWAVLSLCWFPQFPLSRIDDMLADMHRRFEAAGSTCQKVYDTETLVGMATGSKDRAAAGFDKATRTEPDWLSERLECIREGTIGYYRFTERYQEAADAALPFVHGRLDCFAGPVRACAMILYPLLELGRVPEAMRYHRLGYPPAARNPGFLWAVDRHVEFLVLTDNLARAVRLTAKHLPAVLAHPSPATRRSWFATLRLLFERLRAVKDRVAFRLPAGHPLHADGDRPRTADLFAWFDAEARQLAAAFDARDGNGYFTKVVDDQEALKAKVCPYPYANPRTSEESP
jgi:hypothetical protein